MESFTDAFRLMPQQDSLRSSGLSTLTEGDHAGIVGLLLHVLPNIRTLRIHPCAVPPTNFVRQYLEYISYFGMRRCLPRLECIELLGSNIAGDSEFYTFLSLLAKIPTLRSLHVQGTRDGFHQDDLNNDPWPFTLSTIKRYRTQRSSIRDLRLTSRSIDTRCLFGFLLDFTMLQRFDFIFERYTYGNGNEVSVQGIRNALLAPARDVLNELTLIQEDDGTDNPHSNYYNYGSDEFIGSLTRFTCLRDLHIEVNFLAKGIASSFRNLGSRLPQSLARLYIRECGQKFFAQYNDLLRELCVGKEQRFTPKLEIITIRRELQYASSHDYEHWAEQWVQMCSKYDILLVYAEEM